MDCFQSQSLSENLKETMMKLHKDERQLSLSSFETCNFGHNCIRSPCSPVASPNDLKKHKFHLFEADMPELPYYNKYNASLRSSDDYNAVHYKRSIKILSVFVLSSTVICLLTLKTEGGLTKLYSLLPALAAVVALVTAVISASRIPVNPVNSERRCKTLAFPYLTFFNIFLAILLVCTADYGTVAKLTVWMILGQCLFSSLGRKRALACFTPEVSKSVGLSGNFGKL
ncbi:unnamed protein product [Gongylonema pulchrum]|uniref:Vesicle transport protein n=1 Tax=Gongylonema pulchrum TaxID=637853 RepID=A0A183CZG2_9BILA|nr:unnamed protein product [Gongylonema pulchrum]